MNEDREPSEDLPRVDVGQVLEPIAVDVEARQTKPPPRFTSLSLESPDYGGSTRGDFEPLIDEATFYRVQAVLDGRVVVAGPRPRNHRISRSGDSCVARRGVVR